MDERIKPPTTKMYIVLKKTGGYVEASILNLLSRIVTNTKRTGMEIYRLTSPTVSRSAQGGLIGCCELLTKFLGSLKNNQQWLHPTLFTLTLALSEFARTRLAIVATRK